MPQLVNPRYHQGWWSQKRSRAITIQRFIELFRNPYPLQIGFYLPESIFSFALTPKCHRVGAGCFWVALFPILDLAAMLCPAFDAAPLSLPIRACVFFTGQQRRCEFSYHLTHDLRSNIAALFYHASSQKASSYSRLMESASLPPARRNHRHWLPLCRLVHGSRCRRFVVRRAPVNRRQVF